MDIKDLQTILDKIEDRAGEQEAMRSTMLEIGTALADIVQLLERSGPDTAKAIATALKSVRIGDINVPAPVVHVTNQSAGWEFNHEYGPNGLIRRSTAKPLA